MLIYINEISLTIFAAQNDIAIIVSKFAQHAATANNAFI